MKGRWIAVLIVPVLLASPLAVGQATDDGPDNIRPWVPSLRPAAPRAVDGPRQSYVDRTRDASRSRRADHEATQYRSDIAGVRHRLERQNASDRRSFDRLQRLRREEFRLRSVR